MEKNFASAGESNDTKRIQFIKKNISSFCTSKGVFSAGALFFIFKIAEAILEPSIRLYLYDSVCLNRFPDFGQNRTCSNLSNDRSKETIVQEDIAKYMSFYKILINLPAMIAVLCCGAWSDRGGRIAPIIFTCLGTSLACMTYMISSLKIWKTPNLIVLLFGAAIRGAFGRSAIMTMAVNSYVSDHSPVHVRTRDLGNLLALSNFGYLVGSFVSGQLMENIGSDFVFMIVIIVDTVCVFIAYSCMHERGTNGESDFMKTLVGSTEERVSSLNEKFQKRPKRRSRCLTLSASEDFVIIQPPDDLQEEDLQLESSSNARDYNTFSNHQPNGAIDSIGDENDHQGEFRVFTDSNRNDEDTETPSEIVSNTGNKRGIRLGNIYSHLNCLRVILIRRPGVERGALWSLLFILYLHQMNKSGETDTYLLFVKRSPLSVSKTIYGYLLATNYMSLGMFAFLVPKILNCVGYEVKDSTLGMIGILIKIVGLVIIYSSQNILSLYIAAAFTGAISLTVSAARSMISKIVETSETGQAFSLISCGETLFNLLGSLMYISIYRAVLHQNPGICFLVEIAVYVIIFLIMTELYLQTKSRMCFGCMMIPESE